MAKTKEDLMKLKKDNLVDIVINLRDMCENLDTKYRDAESQLISLRTFKAKQDGKVKYLRDLTDVLADTDGLVGKSETEINARLIKAFKILKFNITKVL